MSIIDMTIKAIKKITIPRYFHTERGFVGEFYCKLSKQLEKTNIFPKHTILEMEVQKRHDDHRGLNQRPDLVIHTPIEMGLNSKVNKNNFVVYEFKLNATRKKVKKDFHKLDKMFSRLQYETGIFINISTSPKTYLTNYTGRFKNRIHELCVSHNDNNVLIMHSYFTGNSIITKNK